MEYTAELRNWQIFIRSGAITCLQARGNCYGDTKGRFDPGCPITTSFIVNIHTPFNSDEDWYVETKNSIYKLQKPMIQSLSDYQKELTDAQRTETE